MGANRDPSPVCWTNTNIATAPSPPPNTARYVTGCTGSFIASPTPIRSATTNPIVTAMPPTAPGRLRGWSATRCLYFEDDILYVSAIDRYNCTGVISRPEMTRFHTREYVAVRRSEAGGSTGRVKGLLPTVVLVDQYGKPPRVSARLERVQASGIVTSCSSVPTPSISTSTVSPSESGPTPAGVPVEMTSPASRVR